jgi:cobalt-precorrin-5B (C1)-methyltransferase
MIRDQVELACQDHCYHGGVSVVIFAPEGERIAKKTYNARLGIQGGISILGTTGIVNPMSEDALIDTIKLELAQKIELSGNNIIVCPGNYGETFIKEKLGLEYEPVLCSNYIGEFLDDCKAHNIRKLLLVGHVGKLVKLAGGIMNTHSKIADGRMEIIAAHAAAEGGEAQLVKAILGSTTTEDAFLHLETVPGLGGRVVQRLIEKILEHIGHRVNHEFEVGVILFNNSQEIVGQSDNAMAMLQWFPQKKNKIFKASAERDGA